MDGLEALPGVLKPIEVAEVMRLSPKAVRDLIVAGKLRATNIGKGARPTYRVLRQDLIAYLQGDTNQGKAA